MPNFILNPKYFTIKEFVPKDAHAQFGENSYILMDDRILQSTEQLRILLNKPIICNNWFNGGTLQNRGFRKADYKCAEFSQHKFGRAVDLTIVGMEAEEVRQFILKNQDKFPFIRAMEDKVSWVHIDCRYTLQNGIFLFGAE
jgi:hypothetical protein